MARRDLTGYRVGRWLVTGAGIDRQVTGKKLPGWRCVCDCGSAKNMAAQTILSGDTHSCGCLRRELATPSRTRDIERLLRDVIRLPWSGCWIFGGDQIGTKSFWLDGKVQSASRAAYQLLVGPLPAEMKLCHHCDVPCCINPAHFFLGTQRDNMLDCSRKGRLGGNAVPKHLRRTHR